MKKNRLILTAVLFVCVVVVVVPNWKRLWLAVAYERTPGHAVGFEFFRKRATWLAGESFVVPDQECTKRREESHQRCGFFGRRKDIVGIETNGTPMSYTLRLQGGEIEMRIGKPRCICPDPSHERNR